MILISLVVPTFNRAEYLEKALASFLEQDLAPSLFEIIIIDNNSTDFTNRTVKRVMTHAECHWRLLREPNQGAHFARNRGLLEAKGEIVVFGDDDIIATPSWLTTILEELDHNPETGIVGGKVYPIWSETPEDWIYDYGTEQVHPLFAYLDYGDERLLLEYQYVYSNNMAVRRTLALETGGCFPDAYPRRLMHLTGTGENAIIDNVRNLNYEIVYSPEMLVYHHADASRATLQYFADRYERWAVENVFLTFRNRGKKEAVQYLIQTACDLLLEVEQESRNKINPEVYQIIMKHWAHQTIKQTCRVLTEPSLYAHIKQNSYL